jgi:mannitol-1-phosphate/altronate dehydrogenase
MAGHIFTGFGFGPIQAGLFVKEASQSGNFERIVIAEIDQQLVDAVRANNASYCVNVAKSDGIEVSEVHNVELLNPNIASDSDTLIDAAAQSTEIATCLPSVDFYEVGGSTCPAALIAEGLKKSRTDATIVYTAENNNRAAEILQEAVTRRSTGDPAYNGNWLNGNLSDDSQDWLNSYQLPVTSYQGSVQFLNTVIGKMSRVVTDPSEIAERKLAPVAPGIERAFLVEQFNRILVTRTRISGFEPGIEVFIEKDNLLPFEEAKLYGHNAIHALLGFIGALKGYTRMTELKQDQAVMQIARNAFLQESGAALISKYGHLGDELFTEAGYREYAEDLLGRMTNPYLADTIARVCRDVVRKLGLNERIFGTMQLTLQYGIEPKNMAVGALAGICVLLQKSHEYKVPQQLLKEKMNYQLPITNYQLPIRQIGQVLNWVWPAQRCADTDRLIRYTHQATDHLCRLCLYR